MSIGDAIKNYRLSRNLTQQQLADMVPINRTVITKVESGERESPKSLDVTLSGFSWKVALTVADERTGGFISNILEDMPNLDLHPAALKDLLLKELHDAGTALEGLIMAKHLDPEKRRQSAERVWHELKDVEQKAAVLRGVMEDEFGLDRKGLIKKHEMEVKRGER